MLTFYKVTECRVKVNQGSHCFKKKDNNKNNKYIKPIVVPRILGITTSLAQIFRSLRFSVHTLLQYYGKDENRY